LKDIYRQITNKTQQKSKKHIYEENTTRYIKYASTAMVQTAVTHGISNAKRAL
jgi:ferric iron reductase protein FhuF